MFELSNTERQGRRRVYNGRQINISMWLRNRDAEFQPLKKRHQMNKLVILFFRLPYLRIFRRGVAAISLLACFSVAASAGTSIWEGGQDDDWDDSRNWEGSIPDGLDTAIFGQSSQRHGVDLRGHQNIGSLQFSPFSGNPPWRFTKGSLTLDSGGQFRWLATTAGTSIIVDIEELRLTQGPTVWTGDNNATTLVLTAKVTGDQNWILGDSDSPSDDVLALDHANTYSGTFTVRSGTLRIDHRSALQNATVTGGISGKIDLANGDANFQMLTGLCNVDFGTLGSPVLTVGEGHDSPSIDTYSGSISGAGDLIKTGSGTWILDGINPYTGATRVETGVLQTTSLAASSVEVALGSVLKLTADSTLGGLWGSGAVDFTAANSPPTLTVGREQAAPHSMVCYPARPLCSFTTPRATGISSGRVRTTSPAQSRSVQVR